MLNMDSFLDNVDGCTLTIKDFHTSISFPSPSDAMLASLVLKYAHVTMTLFDDLLTLFHHKDFSSSILKIGRMEDILGHISKQRHLAALARGGKGLGNELDTPRPRSDHRFYVPSLIVELVVDHLETERVPFHHIPKTPHYTCEVDDLFRTMCLVHRSWTNAAQRGLRRRICVKGRTSTFLLLQSPHLGPWVRDLSIRTPAAGPDYGGYQSDDETKDTPRVICEILKRCPNVVNLQLEDFVPTLDSEFFAIDNPFDVIKELANLVQLKHLWLSDVYKCSATDLPKLCTILPSLKSLKSLNLRNWFPGGVEADEGEPQMLNSPVIYKPGHSLLLESLSLNRVLDTDSIGRLLRASPQCNIKTLELSCSDMRATLQMGDAARGPASVWTGLPSFIEPAMPYVTKLILNGHRAGDEIASAIARFPLLEFLRLCLLVETTPLAPITLSSSITSLHIHYAYVPNKRQPHFVIDTLKFSPRIRKLSISYKFNPAQWPSRIDFTAEKDYCEAKGVEFEQRERIGIPSFLEP